MHAWFSSFSPVGILHNSSHKSYWLQLSSPFQIHFYRAIIQILLFMDQQEANPWIFFESSAWPPIFSLTFCGYLRLISMLFALLIQTMCKYLIWNAPIVQILHFHLRFKRKNLCCQFKRKNLCCRFKKKNLCCLNYRETLIVMLHVDRLVHLMIQLASLTQTNLILVFGILLPWSPLTKLLWLTSTVKLAVMVSSWSGCFTTVPNLRATDFPTLYLVCLYFHYISNTRLQHILKGKFSSLFLLILFIYFLVWMQKSTLGMVVNWLLGLEGSLLHLLV